MIKQLKNNLLYSIIIVMSFVTILIITQLNWAYYNDYYDIELRIFLALIVGAAGGFLYLLLMIYIFKKINAKNMSSSMKKLSIIHLFLYLSWFYGLYTKIGFFFITKLLPFIIIIGIMILSILFFTKFLKKDISTYLVKFFPIILLILIYSLIGSCLFLPGINSIFIAYLGMFLLFLVIIYCLYFFLFKKAKEKTYIIYTKKFEKLCISDFIFVLVPLTPIILYIFSNQSELTILNNIQAFLFFVLLSIIFCIAIPLLASRFASKKILIASSTAFLYVIFNMAALAESNDWSNEGSLIIQLIVLIIVSLILMLYKIIPQKIFNTAIILFFIVNFVMGIINLNSNANDGLMEETEDFSIIKVLENREMVKNNDVFLIIYEAYAPYETMLHYGFDNIEQLKFLEENGFNIHHSIYSIGTTTNAAMSRIFNVDRELEGRSYIAGGGAVHRLFKQQGYNTYGIFRNDWHFRGLTNDQIKYDFTFPELIGKVQFFINAILIGELSDEVNIREFEFEQYLKRKQQILKGEFKSPITMYSHSGYPGHSPNRGMTINRSHNILSNHIKGIKKANDEMKQDVELILKHNPDAIVIIAGDHGPFMTKTGFSIPRDRGSYNVEDIDRYDIQDRYGAFLAIRWGRDRDYANKHDIRILQDIFPAVFAYLFDDDSIFEETRIKPRDTVSSIWGVDIGVIVNDDGILIGGKNDGEPLFIMDFDK